MAHPLVLRAGYRKTIKTKIHKKLFKMTIFYYFVISIAYETTFFTVAVC